MTREEFEEQFGSRTAAYLPEVELDRRPVVVIVGKGAHSRPGHLLVSALVNQLARAHSRLVLLGDLERPLLCPSAFGHRTLAEASAGLAREINPFIEIGGEMPADPLIQIVVGDQKPEALAVGCDGWCAAFDQGEVVGGSSSPWGAALAACLASAAAFGAMRGVPFIPSGSYSLWQGGEVGTGQGPDIDGLDIGRVLQVGAGAVGAALDYWLASLDITDFVQWTVVDGDEVDVSNLNRQLLYRARDAGWPEGGAEAKATVSGRLLGAAAHAELWGVDPTLTESEFDLVLALANEGGVRSALQLRQPPVLLHATTSANWQAQSHRHIRGRDDCIRCRIPERPAQTICSTGQISEGSNVDAALPFLSASAGLLLAADIARLAVGELAGSKVNFKAIDFGGEVPASQEVVYRCQAGCKTWLPPLTRQQIAASTRFAPLDAS